VTLPDPLRRQYLRANGGSPDPYVFENDELDTVVAAFLPLTATGDGDTAVETYADLVASKGIVPRHFFPFAVDGGGDYFFVDTATAEGAVYFYRSDSAEAAGLVPLHLGVDDFWSALKPED